MLARAAFFVGVGASGLRPVVTETTPMDDRLVDGATLDQQAAMGW